MASLDDLASLFGSYLFSKTASHEFAPPVTRCWIVLVTPAACLLMQTRAECGREIPNSHLVSRHRNHITFEPVPKVTRFLKACPLPNLSWCQGWFRFHSRAPINHKHQMWNYLVNEWTKYRVLRYKRTGPLLWQSAWRCTSGIKHWNE